jgi:hypothetical protein
MLKIFSRLRGQYPFTYKRINLYTSSHGNKLTDDCQKCADARRIFLSHGNKLTDGYQRDTTSFWVKTGGIVVKTYGIMPVPGVIFRLQEVAS